MNKRDFFKLNQQKLMQTKGTEDIAGRRLPGEVYHFMPRGPYRSRPSKADLRTDGARAKAEWDARKGASVVTAPSS